MADVKRAPTSLTLSSYFPEIPKNGDPNGNVRPKRVEDSRAPRPRNQYAPGRRKSSGDACSANDKGTQTNRPLLESLFPKKKTHPMSHKVMLLSAVLSLAKKEKISGEVESTLLYYLHKEPVIKEAEDLCPMDEDKQAIAFKDIAAKLPFPPYPLKIRGDQKSWLQKSIEEELGPGTPYLITGPEKWNRLDFGATVLFGLHLVYTNHMEKEVPDKGLRFRKVGFSLPASPAKEWFVVDLCNNLSSSDVTAQDFTARMRRLVADGKLDSELLLRFADQFGDESTKEIVKDGTQIFLHQSPHFSSWLKLAAAYHKLGEFTILREYLVAHVLYSLQACGKRVFLKGGCSLSLGYNLINRTSEDIDIRIDPSAGVTWEVNGCENAEHSRAEYFLKLLDTMFIEDGEVELMHTKCKTTQALYHITFDLPHHAPITIVLEVMHKVAPLYIQCKIASKFHQHARDIGTLSQFKQNYDFEIACVHPWQTLYEKIHAVHQNFNKFQNRCVDGNVNAPKWIRHLGDAYNIIRKTRKTELPEDWSIPRLQEELAKSRDFVTDLSPDHPTLRLELLSESERKQVDEAFEMHVEGGYYGVGEEGIVDEGERALSTPTLDEVCETVIGWLKTVPTTFVSVDKFRRFARGNYHPRGGRSHPSSSSSSSSSPSPSSASSDPNAPPSDSNFQGRSYSRNSSYSKPYSGKKFSNSSYNKSNTYHRNNFTNSTYPSTPANVPNDTQPTPTNDEDTSSVTATPAPLSSVACLPSASSSSSSSLSSEAPNITQISRQVDSSYRLSRDFDKVIEPTHSGSNSESDDTNSNYSNYSNESAPESLALETESPSESSAENTENEFAWTSLSVPCPPNNGRRELSISSDFESVSEPASESTSESESERKSEPEFGNEVVILSSISPVSSVSSSLSLPLVEPPHSPVLPAFNEASFGMPKRNSLPLSLSPSPSAPSSPSPQKNNSSTQILA